MPFTFETRLTVSAALVALLPANANEQPRGQRTAWSRLYRQQQSPAQAYADLQKPGFTCHQTRSIPTAVQLKHKALAAHMHDEKGRLQPAIQQREEALKKKQKNIASLEKQRGKQPGRRQKPAPRDGRPRAEIHRHAGEIARDRGRAGIRPQRGPAEDAGVRLQARCAGKAAAGHP